MNKGIKNKSLMIGLLLCLQSLIQHAMAESKLAERFQHSQTETINKVLNFADKGEDNLFTIFNVYGSIDVEGYAGDEVSVVASNQVFASSQILVDQGLQEIGLKFEQ